MAKEVYTIKEDYLRNIIANTLAESVKYSTLDNAINKVERGASRWDDWMDFSDLSEAMDKIEYALQRFAGSFHGAHGQEALNHYYDKGVAPNDGRAAKCLQCLEYIRAFLNRKQNQFQRFNNDKEDMERNYEQQILDICRQNGVDGVSAADALFDLYQKMGENEQAVLNLFPDEVQDFITHNSLI